MPEKLEFPPQEEPEEPGENGEKGGWVHSLREAINRQVEESRLPTKEVLGYESTVGIYGGKLVEDEEGRLVYDTRGFWSQLDRRGDRFLRTVDEHHVKEPGKMMQSHPAKFVKTLPLVADAKRFRGTPEQILTNAHRLGLDDFYGPHPWGIEIKQPDVYKKGIALRDIYRQDEIRSPLLDSIDRFDALAKASEYISSIHERCGGAGELLTGDIIFRVKGDEGVQEPVLNLPDIIYNPEKKIGEKEKMATDLLDFLANVGVEEWRRSKNWQDVERALGTVLTHYGNQAVIKLTKSFAKRGRLTLLGDAEIIEPSLSATAEKSRHYFSMHNVQRIGAKGDIDSSLRKLITAVCERFS